MNAMEAGSMAAIDPLKACGQRQPFRLTAIYYTLLHLAVSADNIASDSSQ
jgi:hypothetical protein